MIRVRAWVRRYHIRASIRESLDEGLRGYTLYTQACSGRLREGTHVRYRIGPTRLVFPRGVYRRVVK